MELYKPTAISVLQIVGGLEVSTHLVLICLGLSPLAGSILHPGKPLSPR